jgi:hypothetical protein
MSIYFIVPLDRVSKVQVQKARRTCSRNITVAKPNELRRRREFGDSFGSFADGVLGKFPR